MIATQDVTNPTNQDHMAALYIIQKWLMPMRDGLALIDLALEWKAQFQEKGWA